MPPWVGHQGNTRCHTLQTHPQQRLWVQWWSQGCVHKTGRNTEAGSSASGNNHSKSTQMWTGMVHAIFMLLYCFIFSFLLQLPLQAPPPCQLELFLRHGYGSLLVRLFRVATFLLQRTPDESCSVEQELREAMGSLKGKGEFAEQHVVSRDSAQWDCTCTHLHIFL